MPYTAPLKTSPSTQHIEHSDLNTPPSPGSPTVANRHAGNLNLPPSYSSASYVRRHRRSPSNSKTFIFPAPDNDHDHNRNAETYASVRQSPSPVNEGPIPPGALLSPPESAQNSSDEEPTPRSRDVLQLEELEAAVRSIEQKRASSPDRQPGMPSTTGGEGGATCAGKPVRTSLATGNRMVVHSQSFVENSITRKQEEALTSSPEDSERDEPEPKSPMVRKKSGELVRPALRPPSARRRPSSMPGTPTYAKAVHFDAQLEHIRHFLQLDKPQAVSAGSSPVEDLDGESEYPFHNPPSEPASFEWGLRLSNFPHKLSPQMNQRVRLERLFLSTDKHSLVGLVVVANLAFEKHVAARFTFDGWRTTSEVIAEYSHDARRKQLHDGYDRFMFNIRLDEQTNLDKKTLFVCIRYNVNGQEYWDNNGARDYQVNFTKIPKAKSKPGEVPRARPRINLPRSRSFTGSGSRPHSMPSSLKDFSEMHRYISFGPPLNDRKGKPEDDDDVPHESEAPVPLRRDKQPHQVFGNRYDFESSLSAVMRTKPEHDRTMLTARAKSGTPVPQSDSRAPSARAPQLAQPNLEKPSSMTSDKPNRESSVYRELVDRYCFFGSPTSPQKQGLPLRAINPGASKIACSSSPSSPPDNHATKESSADASRSLPSSPPSAYSYQYFEPMQERLLNETKTPALISG